MEHSRKVRGGYHAPFIFSGLAAATPFYKDSQFVFFI